MKKSILFIFALSALAANAQIKIGASTDIVSTNFLQINGGSTASIATATESFLAFNSSGYLGIGTTGPTASLDVISALTARTTFALRNNSSGAKYFFNVEGSASTINPGAFNLWDGLADRCRMMIRSNGYVGFGTQSPTAELDVTGADLVRTAIVIRNINGGHQYALNSEGQNGTLGQASFNIYDVTEDRLRFIIKPNTGYVGIGTDANPTSQLDVNGDIEALAVKGPSDKRFKKNIVPLEHSLSKITSLNGYNYEWRRDEFPQKKFKSGTDMGLIAQEVEKVYPEVVYTADDEMKSKSIDYTKLVPALIESIKELKAEIEELKSQMPYQKR